MSLSLLWLLTGCSLTDRGLSWLDSEDGKEMVRTSDDLFYYYYDQKIFLGERQDLIFVSLSGDQSSRDAFWEKVNGSDSPFCYYSESEDKSYVAGDLFLLKSSYPKGIDSQLKDLRSDPAVTFATKVLVYEGDIFGISNEFCVKLKKSTQKSDLDELASEFGCDVFRRDYFSEDIYFLKVEKSSDIGALQLANVFYESGLFDFSEPDMYYFNVFD